MQSPPSRRDGRAVQAVGRLDEVGAALGDHHDPRVAVARRHGRHHARVGDRAGPRRRARAARDRRRRARRGPCGTSRPGGGTSRPCRVTNALRSSSELPTSWPGQQLLAGPLRERLRREDLARELDALDEPVAVGLRREVVRVHARLHQRVGAREADVAARERPHDARQDRDRVRVRLPDDDVEGHVHERDLQVGRRPAPGRTCRRARPRRGSACRSAPAACPRGSRR